MHTTFTGVSPHFKVDSLAYLLTVERPKYLEKLLEHDTLLITGSAVQAAQSKKRYEVLQPHCSTSLDQAAPHPLSLLLLMEACFHLDNIYDMYRYALRLLEHVPSDAYLKSIVEFSVSHLEDCEQKEEEYYDAPTYGDAEITPSSVRYYDRPGPPLYQHVEGSKSSRLLERIRTEWQQCSDSISMEQATELISRLSCIETNILEGVFDIDGQSWPRLIRRGFYANAIEGITQKSKIQEKTKIANILMDTEKALKYISQQRVVDSPENYSTAFLQELHSITMRTSRFERVEYVIDDETFEEITMLMTGEWRRRTCVTFHHINSPNSMALVFASHKIIATEMDYYISEVQKMLQCLKEAPDTVDLLRMVAWMQYAFLRIHPYEDGNGRISRFVSSIPFVFSGLPPVTVQTKSKERYFAALHVADETGDLEPLTEFIGRCMLESISTIRDLPSVAVHDTPAEGRTMKRNSPGVRSHRSSPSNSFCSSMGSA